MGPSTRQPSETKRAARLPPGLPPGAMSSPVEVKEPKWSPTVAVWRGLHTGWTTGTCASAAAKAAYLAFVYGLRPGWVEVALPSGRRVGFPVEWDGDDRAVVVKDSGDDPDCTDGARMTAKVRIGGTEGVHVLNGGQGIEIVTKPGLGLALGEPAINPAWPTSDRPSSPRWSSSTTKDRPPCGVQEELATCSGPIEHLLKTRDTLVS